MKTTDLNYFLQDDWRVSPRLTLNLGVRYEYQRNPQPINVNAILPQTRNCVNDKNNIGPRVGFAFDMNGDGKTSIRGGWGIYYGRVINSTVYNALVNTGVGIDRAQRQVTPVLPLRCRRAALPEPVSGRSTRGPRCAVLLSEVPVAADSPAGRHL